MTIQDQLNEVNQEMAKLMYKIIQLEIEMKKTHETLHDTFTELIPNPKEIING